jgi:hypothetical protein
MIATEYAVTLTVAGKLRVWEEAMAEYTRALGEFEKALVVGAGAIQEIAGEDGGEEYASDASEQWWDGYRTLSPGKQFVVQTRLMRAGVRLPVAYRVVEA